ncbi:MAG: hypothetical protein VCD00_01940 [Candidatus Hydrogenedentota bacterium]
MSSAPYESAEAVVLCSACGVCREAVKPYGGLEHGVTEDDRFAQSRVYEQRMHAALGNYVKEQGEGWKSNPVFVDQYGARHVPDAVTANGTILELKPNSPSGRAAGKRQKARYEAVTGQAVQILYYEPPVEFSEGEMEWTKLKGVLGALLDQCYKRRVLRAMAWSGIDRERDWLMFWKSNRDPRQAMIKSNSRSIWVF